MEQEGLILKFEGIVFSKASPPVISKGAQATLRNLNELNKINDGEKKIMYKNTRFLTSFEMTKLIN